MVPTFTTLLILISSSWAQTPTTSCPSAPSPTVTTITGPLLQSVEFGDPSIHQDPAGVYYVYATNQNGDITSNQTTSGTGCGPNVPYAYTTNLTNPSAWTYNTYVAGGTPSQNPSCSNYNGTIYDAMPRISATNNGLGSWTNTANPGQWNPDVIRLDAPNNNSYVIYYSAIAYDNYIWPVDGNNYGGLRCVGIGFSPTPTGPFNPANTPIICASGGVIGLDSVLGNGKRWLLFKDGSCPGNNPSCTSYLSIIQLNVNTGYPIQSPPTPTHLTTSGSGSDDEEGPAVALMCNSDWLLLHTDGNYQQSYRLDFAISNTGAINGTYTNYNQTAYTLIQSDQNFTSGGAVGPTGTSNLWLPGSPDFLGSSNYQFIFSGRPNSLNNYRHLYYAELGYVSF